MSGWGAILFFVMRLCDISVTSRAASTGFGRMRMLIEEYFAAVLSPTVTFF
jgi:hypothetical protein